MVFDFQRPNGAAADVAELEYVSALLQTRTKVIRTNGILTARDIALFLRSRYGLDIEEEELGRLLIPYVDANGDGFDLVEFVTLLLIPRLQQEAAASGELEEGAAEAANDDVEQAPAESGQGLMGTVIDILLQKVPDLHEGGEITHETLRSIFEKLDEHELAVDDDLMKAMVRKLTTDNSDRAVFNAETFSRALTYDLTAYEAQKGVSTNLHDSVGDTTPYYPAWQTLLKDLCWPCFPSDEQESNLPQDVGGGRRTGSVPSREQCNDPPRDPNFCRNLNFEFTAPSMDFVADTYRSRVIVVLLWSFFATSFFTYYSGIGTFADIPECAHFDMDDTWVDNAYSFICSVGWSLGRWLYVAMTMSVYGLVYFGLCGMGNAAETNNMWVHLIAAAAAALFTCIPPLIPAFYWSQEMLGRVFRSFAILLGSAVVVLNLLSAISSSRTDESSFWKRCCNYLTLEAVGAESHIKKAALKKLEAMVNNSIKIHKPETQKDEVDEPGTDQGDDSEAEDEGDVALTIHGHIGQAVTNYNRQEKKHKGKSAGGLFWTWGRIANNKILSEEGIWFSARLVSINVSQFITAFFILGVGLAITIVITEDYKPPITSVEDVLRGFFELVPNNETVVAILQEVNGEISDFLAYELPDDFCPDVSTQVLCDPSNIGDCTVDRGGSCLCTLIDYTRQNNGNSSRAIQDELLNCAGFPVVELFDMILVSVALAAQQSIDSLYPREAYMIFYPLLLATLAAFVMALSVALSVIPSMTTTILKLRSGVQPLMHDPKQRTIRIAPDQCAFLHGAMFWGLLLSSGLMASIVLLISFFAVYQHTRAVVQRIFAILLGAVVVCLMHWGLVKYFRRVTSKTFYRQKPFLANLILLARECTFFALSIWFTFVRVMKLLVTTALFVGRVDIPFLAPGVGEIKFWGYRFDNTPYVFLMDILQHEAHRHPYVEIFGVICLLKLRHGPNFITRAGSAWRILLVLVLMPWLTKYRNYTRGQLPTGQSDETLGTQSRPRRAPAALGSSSPPVSEPAGEPSVEDLKREIRELKQQIRIDQVSSPLHYERSSSQGLLSRSSLQRQTSTVAD